MRSFFGETWWRGNPYVEFGRRPFREARLRSYLIRQHRAGRSLVDVLADPYVRRCGSESLCWRVLRDPQTLEALRRHDAQAIALASAEVQGFRGGSA